MSVYLDASVLIPQFVDDVHSERADALIGGTSDAFVVSDFAAAEFSSGLSRLVRMSELARDVARATFAKFDLWTKDATRRIELTSADIGAAEILLRRLEFPLTTPDMLHLALAQRHGLRLATFDARMASAATVVGLEVA